MQKIAALGAIYKNQSKTVNNSGIAKSIETLSEKAGNERDSIVNRPYETDLLLSLFNIKELDVRNFSTGTKAQSQNDINNTWQNSSNTVSLANKNLTQSNTISKGTYDNAISNRNLNFSNNLNQGSLMNHGNRGAGHSTAKDVTNVINSFGNIRNDGTVNPLYDSSKHTAEENKKISDQITVAASSSSSEVSNATSSHGEAFTKAFTDSILAGKSLQETIKNLDGKGLGSQTSQAYNTEILDSKKEISAANQTKGTAIIFQGSDHGVSGMMQIDRENLKAAYTKLGFDVKMVAGEAGLEKAIQEYRKEAIASKANGEELNLAVHGVSHGTKVGGGGGANNADAHGALAMADGSLYHEKDIMGDIAAAVAPITQAEIDALGDKAGDLKAGDTTSKHLYASFTACHSGALDHEQAFKDNNGQTGSSQNEQIANNTENQGQKQPEAQPA